MNKIFIVIPLVALLLIPSISQARELSRYKDNTLFFSGLVGSGALGPAAETATNVDDDQESDGVTTFGGSIGYKFKYLSLELFYMNLGKPENEVGDNTYVEAHNLSFIGPLAHWTWGWFDLKVGLGAMRDKVTYSLGDNGTSLSVTNNGKSESSGAFCFGFGFNFDLGSSTELIIDYSGFIWGEDLQRTMVLDGTTSTWDSNAWYMGSLGIGLRFFL